MRNKISAFTTVVVFETGFANPARYQTGVVLLTTDPFFRKSEIISDIIHIDVVVFGGLGGEQRVQACDFRRHHVNLGGSRGDGVECLDSDDIVGGIYSDDVGGSRCNDYRCLDGDDRTSRLPNKREKRKKMVDA